MAAEPVSRSPADVWRELKAAHAKPGFDGVWSKLRTDQLRSNPAVQPASRKSAEPLIAARPACTLNSTPAKPLACSDAAATASAGDAGGAAAAVAAAAPSAERLAQQLLDPDTAVRRTALRHMQVTGWRH